MSALQNSVLALDVLMLATVGTVLLNVRKASRSTLLAIAMSALALGWGLLWSYWPILSELRLTPFPGGLAVAIGGLSLALSIVTYKSSHMREADPLPIVQLSYWRIVYGAVLLAFGGAGQLPPEFFWSAATGDILAGLFGMLIIAGHIPPTRKFLMAWNFFGLADLLHVLVLGAIFLRPFFIANPDVVPLNLLPLAGVPLFIALHVGLLVPIWKQRKTEV